MSIIFWLLWQFPGIIGVPSAYSTHVAKAKKNDRGMFDVAGIRLTARFQIFSPACCVDLSVFS
jgi:hypothetical protein